jgi:hypothetical protein
VTGRSRFGSAGRSHRRTDDDLSVSPDPLGFAFRPDDWDDYELPIERADSPVPVPPCSGTIATCDGSTATIDRML